MAAFKFTDSNGIEILIIAAVASGDDAYAELKVDIRAAVRAFQCPVGFFRANVIARNAMGKPIRAMLAEQMQAAINRAAAASNATPPSVQPTGHGLI